MSPERPADRCDRLATTTPHQLVVARIVAGVDEAGRGPLAGPVIAAAVMFDETRPIRGLRDSKRLGPKVRERLADNIRARSLAWSVGRADVMEIDALNILQAALLAMRRAVQGLRCEPDLVLVDGNRLPKLSYPMRAIVGGDRLVAQISAASILAKVTRDQEMRRLDRRYPEYGFAQHKGYPTTGHRAALSRHGPCPAHRRSFAPVRRALASIRDG